MNTNAAVESLPFSAVYAEHVPAVWRYVRCRIPDHHEAQDVTSDVFVRALNRWETYDPARGSVAAWLCGIAHHAVADWWRDRRRRPVLAQEMIADCLADDEAADAGVRRDELLRALGQALAGLDDRERDALALRFAAGLRSAEIGRILGTSAGATRVMLSRAVAKLRGACALQDAEAPAELASLDDVVDAALADAADLSRPELAELTVHLAAVHRPPVPEGLVERIGDCLGCAGRASQGPRGRRGGRPGGGAGTGPGRPRSPLRRAAAKFGLAPVAGLGWVAAAPLCVGCAAPAVWPLLAAIGLIGTFGWWFHIVALIGIAPLLYVVLVVSFRRHRRWWPLAIGTLGVGILATHSVLHFVQLHASWWPWAFNLSGQLGALVLFAALLANWFVMSRWARTFMPSPQPAA